MSVISSYIGAGVRLAKFMAVSLTLPGFRSPPFFPHGYVAFLLTLICIFSVLLLDHRSPGIYLTFEAGLSLLKAPKLFHLCESRLRLQVFMGQGTRATKTISSLVILEGYFKHPFPY